MFQLSLCVSGLNAEYIEKYKVILKKEILKNKGVFSFYEKDDFLYFLIVSNAEKTSNTEKVIKQFISNAIVQNYKKQLIVNSVEYCYAKDIKYYALIQALLNFDKTCDEQFIKNKLDFSSGEMYINSFYYFQCSLLREKWKQLINITNQNSKFLNIEENYLDILRFLIEGIDRSSEIEIEFKNKKFEIKSKEKTIQLKTYKSLVNYIIENNPKKLFLKNIDKTFVCFIKQIFLSRVTVSNIPSSLQ